MENPFESGHIRNYVLFYTSVVVIVMLFFIASTLFEETKVIEKKVFSTKIDTKTDQDTSIKQEEKPTFRLLDKAY